MSELANRGPEALSGGTDGRSPAEIARDLAIDTLVDLQLIHSGRSASLFRAYQLPTQRRVAVKVLHDELSSDTGQRFDRERAITGQLSGHTGIVPLFDTGTTSDDEPYLVMPFYLRGSLDDLMTRYGPLGWREATFLLDPVAVTLAEVHSRKLVHRNLKPGNILLTDFLLPRVADFGMCLPIGDVSTGATLVEASGYRAPETAETGPADPRNDVYGLGATLFGLVTGRDPAAGLLPEPTPAIGDEQPMPASGVPTPGRGVPTPPPALVELIEWSMAPDLADRPSDAAAFVTELRRCVSQSDDPSTPQRVTPSNLDPVPPPIDDILGVEPVVELVGDEPLIDLTADPAVASPSPSADEAGAIAQRVETQPSPSIAETAEADRSKAAASQARTEFYVLLLVSVITVGILTMVAAAFLTGN